MTATNEFKTDWASPPGETILDFLSENEISREKFAHSIGQGIAEVDSLLVGNLEITPEIAKKLEESLGGSSKFWLQREAQYRQDLLRLTRKKEKDVEIKWLEELPIKDMARFGWIPASSRSQQTVDACFDYFGVQSVDQWRGIYGGQASAVSFRTSAAFTHNPGALAAWLRKGELVAKSTDCLEWSSEKFRSILNDARLLTRDKKPSNFLPILKGLCASAGVVLVIAKGPSGCRASGAAKFVDPDKALILLSFRHLSDDHFWFSFFHEAGHLLMHSKKRLFVDGPDEDQSKEEIEANTFAQEILIPSEHKSQLDSVELTPVGLLRLAKSIGVSAGIVVGQLQNKGRISYARLNRYKTVYDWDDINSSLDQPLNR